MKKWKEDRGSITVEAVFLIPMVFFILLAVIHFAYYQADKTTVQTTADRFAKEQAVALKERVELGEQKKVEDLLQHKLFCYVQGTGGKEETLRQKIKEDLQGKLLNGEVEQIRVSVGYTEITVEVTVSFRILVSQVKEYFTGTPLQYTQSISIPVHNPAEFARAYSALELALDDVGAFETLKEQLRRIKNVLS